MKKTKNSQKFHLQQSAQIRIPYYWNVACWTLFCLETFWTMKNWDFSFYAKGKISLQTTSHLWIVENLDADILRQDAS